MAQLQNRAVYDLGCGARQVAIYHLDERTKAAVGCGRRLLYVESCQPIRGRYTCTWVLNTPTFAQAQWPQWYAAPKPATYVVLPAGQAAAGRPMATTLFDREGAVPPPSAGPPPGPSGATSGPARPAGPQSPPASVVPPSPPPTASSATAPATPSAPSNATSGEPPRVAPPNDEVRGRIISTELFEGTEGR